MINAPAVLLNLNGGYDATVTPSEFATPQAVERYLAMLHDPAPVDPAIVAPYYSRVNYARFIQSGKLAMVNAVAYRSPKMSKEPHNLALSELLPSTRLHRRWLREQLLTDAAAGKRLAVVHRWSMWNLDQKSDAQPGLVFSRCPASPNLSRTELEAIEQFSA